MPKSDYWVAFCEAEEVLDRKNYVLREKALKAAEDWTKKPNRGATVFGFTGIHITVIANFASES